MTGLHFGTSALQRKGLEDDVKAQMERGISDALRGCADSSFCPDR